MEMLTKYAAHDTPVDVMYLDLAKAFDKVHHRRLIEKLRAHGIDGNTLKWIEAWLADRTQRVVIQGAKSETSPVRSSVVQGSVLGPLCFLVFMNDLEDDIDSKVSKFADGTKLSRPVSTDQDIQMLQDDLDKLTNWSGK